MPGTKAGKNGVKTYGFLVAIEADKVLTKDHIVDLISMGIDESFWTGEFCIGNVDVEALGEIDCYEEEAQAPKGASA